MPYDDEFFMVGLVLQTSNMHLKVVSMSICTIHATRWSVPGRIFQLISPRQIWLKYKMCDFHIRFSDWYIVYSTWQESINGGQKWLNITECFSDLYLGDWSLNLLQTWPIYLFDEFQIVQKWFSYGPYCLLLHSGRPLMAAINSLGSIHFMKKVSIHFNMDWIHMFNRYTSGAWRYWLTVKLSVSTLSQFWSQLMLLIRTRSHRKFCRDYW